MKPLSFNDFVRDSSNEILSRVFFYACEIGLRSFLILYRKKSFVRNRNKVTSTPSKSDEKNVEK